MIGSQHRRHRQLLTLKWLLLARLGFTKFTRYTLVPLLPLMVNGYLMFRLERVERKCGGVSVYVRGGIQTAVPRTAKHEFGLAKKHEP